MNDTATHRGARLNVKSIELPFLVDTADGPTLAAADVWREDRLVCTSGPETKTYLVLDFAEQERKVTVGQLNQSTSGPPITSKTVDWVRTGIKLIQIQAIDPDTGEGLAHPMVRPVLPPPDEEEIDTTWLGWTVLPVSPRRSAE
jgi:hypothetical protein